MTVCTSPIIMNLERFFYPLTRMRKSLGIILISGAATVVFAGASLNMLGNQSQNTGMTAVPLRGPVTIDGKLGDWDLSGRLWSFADINSRDEYSVETAAMWDHEFLYLALKWKDPTPLYNLVDPKFNPNDGWKSDALQLRIKTDQTMWITAWQYSPDRSASLWLDVWKDSANSKAGLDSKMFFGKPGGVDLGEGIQMAYTLQPGGYIQEMRIPWKLLYKQLPKMGAGNKFRMGLDFYWGEVSGKKWPEHRYADNLQPGVTEREFFWTAQNAWGDIELSATGNLPLRQYRPVGMDMDGPVSIKLEIPKQARRFTVVIENEKGQRVRNLLADRDPVDFTTSTNAAMATVQLGWDGADDAGKSVASGNYRVRGLWHEGLDAIYDLTFYNPGTPQWQTADGSGAWGADHYPPNGVVASGDWMILSWPFAEGGSGLIGVGPDGRKKWGEIRGSLVTAANAQHVFSIMNSWHGSGNLGRYDKATGAYAPFVLDGKPLGFELPLAGIITNVPDAAKSKLSADMLPKPFVTAMVADDNRLAIALADDRIVILDAATARLSKELSLVKPTALVFGRQGQLYAILDGKLHEVDIETGKATPISTPGLTKAGALAVNAVGEIAIMDLGPEAQVKIYSPAGILISTAGKTGGRAIRGAFVPEAMSHVTSIAFDAKGNLWAVENWNFPRRVSVWGRDGKLVRDYIGNTGYSGAGAYLYSEDPSIGYVGPVELKLDREKRISTVTRILWKADESRADEPKSFDLDPLSNLLGQRFRSSASGKPHEYLFKQPIYFHVQPSVLFMEDQDGSWRPVAAVGMVGQISGTVSQREGVIEAPKGDFTGLSAWDGFFWNDENSDGRVQRSECIIVPSSVPSPIGGKAPAKLPLPMGAAWNNTMDPLDLSYYTIGIKRIKPLRFMPSGAPVYGPESVESVVDVARFHLPDQRWLNPVVTTDKSRIIGVQTMNAWGGSPAFIGIDAKTLETQWTYPNLYPGVHASHKAPMPKPGLVIGPLKVTGAARINDEVGEVIALRGNLGQDFFFTTDGLNIGSLFRDTRYPSGSLPANELEIRGKSVANLSEGGEPFSGWFGKQQDGKIRMTMSMIREAALIVEVKGLESIRRFDGPVVTLTDKQLEQAAQARAAAEQAAEPMGKSYRIVHTAAPLPLNGAVEVWNAIPAVAIVKEGSSESARAQIASDGTSLYLRVAVTDASPLMNEGKDFTRLFKTGDAVDLQLGPDERAERVVPGAGDRRVLLSLLEGKPVAILMCPVDKSAPPAFAKTYMSPVGSKRFDRVQPIAEPMIYTATNNGGYVISAAIPWTALGVKPASGLKLRGDIGFISSDSSGKRNIARTYWANSDTGLVNDEPQESWLLPKQWGNWTLE